CIVLLCQGSAASLHQRSHARHQEADEDGGDQTGDGGLAYAQPTQATWLRGEGIEGLGDQGAAAGAIEVFRRSGELFFQGCRQPQDGGAAFAQDGVGVQALGQCRSGLWTQLAIKEGCQQQVVTVVGFAHDCTSTRRVWL